MFSVTADRTNEPSIIEDLGDPDWKTATVFFRRRNPATGLIDEGSPVVHRLEIINIATRQRYFYEAMIITALKAGELIVGIPLYTMANIAVHVVRLAVLTISIFARSVADLISGFNLASLQRFSITLPTEMSVALFQTVWSLVKAPICALGMEFCAICATVSPIKWRVHLANVEAFWRGTDRFHNLNNCQKASIEGFTDFWTNPYSEYGFFLATCFQPWGTLDDKNIFKDPADGSDKFIIEIPTA